MYESTLFCQKTFHVGQSLSRSPWYRLNFFSFISSLETQAPTILTVTSKKQQGSRSFSRSSSCFSGKRCKTSEFFWKLWEWSQKVFFSNLAACGPSYPPLNFFDVNAGGKFAIQRYLKKIDVFSHEPFSCNSPGGGCYWGTSEVIITFFLVDIFVKKVINKKAGLPSMELMHLARKNIFKSAFWKRMAVSSQECMHSFPYQSSGQIIVASHDPKNHQNGWFRFREIPKVSGKSPKFGHLSSNEGRLPTHIFTHTHTHTHLWGDFLSGLCRLFRDLFVWDTWTGRGGGDWVMKKLPRTACLWPWKKWWLGDYTRETNWCLGNMWFLLSLWVWNRKTKMKTKMAPDTV